MKKILLIFFAAFSMIASVAQDNNVKLNIANLTYGDIRLGYERVLNDNLTVQSNIGFLIPRKLPGLLFDEEAVEEEYDGEIDVTSKLTGYNLSLELRYYPGSKGAPRGFYLAPYMKYNNWKVDVTTGLAYDVTVAQYNDLTPAQQETAEPSGDPDRPYTVTATGYFTGKFTQAGGGLMLGYQWVVNDRLSIDLNFFGLGIESDKIHLAYRTDAPDVDYEDWAAEIEEGADDFAAFGAVDVEVDSDEVRVGLGPFILPSPRVGFSIGYTF